MQERKRMSSAKRMPILRKIRARSRPQRWQRKYEFEYLDRLSIDAGLCRQQAGSRQKGISAVPSVIVSQSADADNVPTTCVILASLHLVAGESQLRLSMCGGISSLPPSLPLSLPATNSVM